MTGPPGENPTVRFGMRRFSMSAVVTSALFLMLSASMTAQTTSYVPALTFDVTSVRECPPGSQKNGFSSPLHSGHLTGTCVWADQLIGWAFGVNYLTQIVGGPDWVRMARSNEVRFEVQATSDGATDAKLAKLSDDQATLEKQHMMQAMLRDRFRLKAHLEEREEPAFALTVAKRGPKLQKGIPPPPRPEGKTGSWPAPIESERDQRGLAIVGHGASMTDLVELLRFYTRKRIIDQTRIAGTWNFTLQFHGTLSDMQQADDSMWPPLETAIREQLGLELRDTKAPLQVVVIDHIEMPSPN